MYFQDVILELNKFWARKGCVIVQPYEALKTLTRTHKNINAESIAEFVDSLDVSQTVKAELLKITPENYTGITKF